MTENEANIYSIAYRDCKEVSDSIDANEEVGKANAILFYMDEILEALKMASELQAIGTVEEFKAFKLGRLGNKGFITIGQTIGEFKEEIRAKAIDKFAEVLKEKNKTWIIGNRMIDEIAEKLKGDAE